MAMVKAVTRREMAFGFGVLEVERVAQGLQGDVVGALEIGHGGLELVGAGLDKRFQIR